MMDYNIGDKVKFLNDTGGGTVTKIVDKKNVMVLTEYDFEVPVKTEELLLVESASTPSIDSSYFEEEVEENNVVEEKIVEEQFISEYNDELGDDVNIYIAFLHDEDKDEYIIFLINDSNYDLFYSYSLNDEDEWKLKKSEILEANTKLKFSSIERDFINNKNKILIQGVLFSNRLFEKKDPVSKIIQFDPVEFFKNSNWKNSDFFEEKANVLSVYRSVKLEDAVEQMEDEDLDEIIIKKESPKAYIKEKVTKKHMEEVDLHLQEVIDDPTGLSKADMLEIQMNMFREKLDIAIKNKQKKIVFIHGLGNGKLKSEIRREIDNKYKNCKYQDASFQQYGFGATLVMIY